MDLARARNSIPLPPLRDTPGISLPAEADTLLQPNYQISLRANAREENGEGFDMDCAECMARCCQNWDGQRSTVSEARCRGWGHNWSGKNVREVECHPTPPLTALDFLYLT